MPGVYRNETRFLLHIRLRTPIAPAGQQTVNCSVSYVQYSNERLVVSCGGTEYKASGPGCTTCAFRQSLDNLKIWTSLAQGARLSNKTLTINWDNGDLFDCGNAITLIRLN